MKRTKIINGVILVFIGILGIAYGAGPYDEIIDDLKVLQKELGFIYVQYVGTAVKKSTPEEKSKACEEMEKVCKDIEEKLKTILSLKEVKDYISIDIQTIKEKIAGFRKSKQILGGCSDELIFKSYLGKDEDTISGLRGLLKNLIDDLSKEKS